MAAVGTTNISDGAALGEILDRACSLAHGDFVAAIAQLRADIAGAARAPDPAALADHALRKLAQADYDAISCLIYLLADAADPALAAAFGQAAVNGGCENDAVLIAQADILHRQGRPDQAAALLLGHHLDGRSSHYIVKAADFQRDSGRAFLAEDLLRRQIENGRLDLRLRLAEHFVEFREWRSAYDALQAMTIAARGAYGAYLLGRCCVSLLLENELVAIVGGLDEHVDPAAACYGDLLADLWRWRTAADKAPRRQSYRSGPLLPLAARDAARLSEAGDAVSRPQALPSDDWPTADWRAAAHRARRVNLLGIGMQRTATTWLWRQLSCHGEVHPLSFKEPAYFSDTFDARDRWIRQLAGLNLVGDAPAYWAGPTRNVYDYFRMFSEPRPIRADFSPAYGELPEETVAVVAEILGAETKILMSARDPVERSWSNFKFDAKLARLDPMQFTFDQRIAHYTSSAPLRRADYAGVLGLWRAYFRDIMVVFYDDVVERPKALIDDVWRFVGLTPVSHDMPTGRANASHDLTMPLQDRAFLLHLHQPNYDRLERTLGGPALIWRARQTELLNAGNAGLPPPFPLSGGAPI